MPHQVIKNFGDQEWFSTLGFMLVAACPLFENQLYRCRFYSQAPKNHHGALKIV